MSYGFVTRTDNVPGRSPKGRRPPSGARVCDVTQKHVFLGHAEVEIKKVY
jgi:hypothetical protein